MLFKKNIENLAAFGGGRIYCQNIDFKKIVFNSKEIWYRVRVGSYVNYNSAKAAADALSSTLEMPTWVDFVRKEQ